jgi:formyltetrahydrofolate synthetase
VYELEAPFVAKIKAAATKIYGAAGISADEKVRRQLEL